MSAAATFATRLRRAAERRAALAQSAHTNAFRWVNAAGDGLPDITLDTFAGVGVLSLYRALDAPDEQALLDAAVQVLHPSALYVKRRPREARVVAGKGREALAPEAPLWGQAVAGLTALENGLRCVIRPGQGLSVGAYLDMRDTRSWLRREVGGRAVLNLFAYTCLFGVAACAGGAARAVNVDLSRKVLDWGEQNARENGQDPKRADFLAFDSFEWLKRLQKRGEAFDLVVLDPPSFASARGRPFSAGRDYGRLVAAAAPALAPRGLLLACCNLASLSQRSFEQRVLGGAAEAGRDARVLQRLGPSPVDFPAPPGAEPALKVLVLELA